MAEVVDTYLRALVAHDWAGLRATLAPEGLSRIGPFCDRIEGTDAYLNYLRTTMPLLQQYELRIRRTTTVEDRTYVELTETLEVDGRLTTYPECLLFEVDDTDRIKHVSVFIMTPPTPPDAG